MRKLSISIAISSFVIAAASMVQAAPVKSPDWAMPVTQEIRISSQAKELCTATLFGKKAQLWLENGSPVKYKWHNRNALPAGMRGDMIKIQASPVATISKVVIGENSSGQKTITGDFRFKSNSQNGVTFTCR